MVQSKRRQTLASGLHSEKGAKHLYLTFSLAPTHGRASSFSSTGLLHLLVLLISSNICSPKTPLGLFCWAFIHLNKITQVSKKSRFFCIELSDFIWQLNFGASSFMNKLDCFQQRAELDTQK
jgi:hypothetical protein